MKFGSSGYGADVIASPSSRGRGLKSAAVGETVAETLVALFTRAWIEIKERVTCIRGIAVALFTRAWIEIYGTHLHFDVQVVALFTRAWIEIRYLRRRRKVPPSPSSRGRGLKFFVIAKLMIFAIVALFTRAWIEIRCRLIFEIVVVVALFTRAWIEIGRRHLPVVYERVALFTRAWIEISLLTSTRFSGVRSPSSRGRGLKFGLSSVMLSFTASPSSRGRGLKCNLYDTSELVDESPSSRGRGLKSRMPPTILLRPSVALFTRAWIEIKRKKGKTDMKLCRPLHEGVD